MCSCQLVIFKYYVFYLILNLPPGKVDNSSIRLLDHCPFHLLPREWKSDNVWVWGVFLNSAARCCISIWYRVFGYKFVNSIFSSGENTDWVWLKISYLNLEKSLLIRIIITSNSIIRIMLYTKLGVFLTTRGCISNFDE